MTSNKALKELKENAQEIRKWELDRLEIIGKDLEILDILKKHYDNNAWALSLNSFIVFTIHNDDKDFHKIKEWLENGKINWKKNKLSKLW